MGLNLNKAKYTFKKKKPMSKKKGKYSRVHEKLKIEDSK